MSKQIREWEKERKLIKLKMEAYEKDMLAYALQTDFIGIDRYNTAKVFYELTLDSYKCHLLKLEDIKKCL